MDSRNDVASPSLLNSFRQENYRAQANLDMTRQRRLVDYTPSLDSDCENEEFMEQKSCNNKKNRGIDIYNPYSDSNEENEDFIRKGEKTPEKRNKKNASGIREIRSPISAKDDSYNDVPLIELKNKIPSMTTFKELIPTPNFAVVKSRPRRKAINYKGQRIVKDLFEKRQDNNNDMGKTKDATIRKNMKKISNKENKKLTKKNNKKKKSQKKIDKNKKTKTDMKDKWFCHGCKLEREQDMRRCIKCAKWYHEECVGLTKNDNEAFFCPDCI
ncbi:jg12804 [Pararge aegeria aegeria]|uniref:Jg12804 protein n=1 Tax=Pararge aegeria aegeria TaxID=348720 RepID=A0A8S4RJI3_9NEOP|nr:jg12804 [Pararge aegeria aegeria]